MKHSKLPIAQQEAIKFAIENITYISDVRELHEDDEPEHKRRCFFLNDNQKDFLKKMLLNRIEKKLTRISKLMVMVVEFDESEEQNVLNMFHFRIFKGDVIGARIDKHVYDLLNAEENVNDELEDDPKTPIKDFLKKQVAKQKAEKVLFNQQIEEFCEGYEFIDETALELEFRDEYGDAITINKVSGDMWSQVDLAFELLGLDAVNHPEKVIEVEYYIREKLIQLTKQTEVTQK